VDCTCANFSVSSYEEYIRHSAETPLAFTPGNGFLYSNAGYGLLTGVIERVSGRHYSDFLHSRIFGPLGMRDTGYGTIPGKAVKGYIRTISKSSQHEEWRKGAPAKLEAEGGFGGLYSTVDDMLNWNRALTAGTILSAASRKAMFADYGHNYGFGWRFAAKFNRKLVWHTGNDPSGGYASIVDRFPEEDLTVIVLTNNTGFTRSTATLVIGGKVTTFPANAARNVVERLEALYFSGKNSQQCAAGLGCSLQNYHDRYVAPPPKSE